LKVEITRLKKEIEDLQEEIASQGSLMTENAKLNKTIKQLQREKEQDKTIIAYFESERHHGSADAIRIEDAPSRERIRRSRNTTRAFSHIRPER
jgi:hypothetical protein